MRTAGKLRAVVIVVGAATSSGTAGADGSFFMKFGEYDRAAGWTGVASPEQKGVVIELPQGREALLLQTTYHGPARDFAWVIPVPGKPGPDDVFLAEPAFIGELTKNTVPEVRTSLTQPTAAGVDGEAAMGGMEPGVEKQVAGVTVHHRLEVGQFAVAVLSATGPDVLTKWLQESGYRVPDGAAPLFRHYVGRQWYFVALKMQPAHAAEQPVLSEVDPVGIRFPTEKLVYPLHISRVSSREKTALLLFVMARGPVTCDQIPDAELPLEREHPEGSCYAAIRKALADSGSPALVTEYSGPEGAPYPDLYYLKDAWLPDEGKDWKASELWTTRYWTLLDLEEMEDLTFRPASSRSSARLVIHRTAVIDPTVLAGLSKTEPSGQPDKDGLRRHWPVAVVGVLALAGLLVLVARAVRRGSGVTSCILGGLVLLGGASLWAGLSLGGRSPAEAGTPVQSAAALEHLDSALRTLDEMLEAFREAYGCWPARLEDLVAGRPTQGVDSSGNAVEIAQAASAGMPAAGGDLPIDPLTGQRDTWLYEPTGRPMVDSGGFAVRLALVEATEPHEGESLGLGRDGGRAYLAHARRQANRYWLPESEPPLPFRRDSEWPPEVPTAVGFSDTLVGWVRTSQGCRVVLASVSLGFAEVGDGNSEVGALAFAPDRGEYVYAGRDGKWPWIFRHGPGAHERARPIVRRTWPVEVLSLAWHPAAEKWAVVARELEAPEDRARLYVIDAAGVPRSVGEPGPYHAIAYSPTGSSLLAVVGAGPEGAALQRVPLSGGATEVLARQVALRPFRASPDGCVAVRSRAGTAQSLLLVDAQDELHELPLPTQPCHVLDAWAGDEDLLVALEKPGDPVGEVWSWDLSDGKWEVVVTWDMETTWQPKAEEGEGGADKIAVLGRGPAPRSCLIALPHGGWQVYAISDHLREPVLEVLGQPPGQMCRSPWVRARIEGKEENLHAQGILWPNAFWAGDLVVRPPFDKQPFEAEKITKGNRDSVMIGRERLRFFDDRPIRIERDAYRRFLAKVSRGR